MIEPATRTELRKLSNVAKRKSVTDCSASSRETIRPSLLESLSQRWNEFVQRKRREITVDEFAYAIAVERRVRESLYPKS